MGSRSSERHATVIALDVISRTTSSSTALGAGSLGAEGAAGSRRSRLSKPAIGTTWRTESAPSAKSKPPSARAAATILRQASSFSCPGVTTAMTRAWPRSPRSGLTPSSERSRSTTASTLGVLASRAASSKVWAWSAHRGKRSRRHPATVWRVTSRIRPSALSATRPRSAGPTLAGSSTSVFTPSERRRLRSARVRLRASCGPISTPQISRGRALGSAVEA
jgi:hypothetical protein